MTNALFEDSSEIRVHKLIVLNLGSTVITIGIRRFTMDKCIDD